MDTPTAGQRLKHLVIEVRQGWSPQCYPWPADGVETWGVLKVGAANGGVFRATENKQLPADEIPRPELSVSRGDLVISRANTRELLGSAAVVDRDYPKLMLCDKLYALKLDPLRADSRFVALTLGTRKWRGLIELESSGSSPSMQNISQSDILNLPMDVPPITEQRAIVDYLDRETARIDTLIEEQQRLIEMLRGRREATVSEAIAGPELVRLRRLVDTDRPMTYGILQCGDPVPNGVPYIGPSDMSGQGQSPTLSSLRRTTEEIAAMYKRSVLSGGDVVVSIGPAYGKIALVDADLTGANLTQDTVRVAARSDLVDSRYLVWVLLSREVSQYWDIEIMGATFRRLNLGTLARTPIPLPPLDEQRRVVAHLDEQTEKIDTLITETEKFIELSRERRAALITAAVTGQIDMREVA